MQLQTYKLSNADYDAIARYIRDLTPEYDKTFEVVCELQTISLSLNVAYEVEYQNCIGGAYEDYDFEVLNKVSCEFYSIKDYQICTADGDQLAIAVDTTKIEKLLN